MFYVFLILLAVGFCPRRGDATEIISAGSGFWDVTNTWSPQQVPTNTDNVTITNGCTVTNRDVITHYVASLTIQTNGVLTHTSNTTAEAYKVILNIASNLTIDLGGQINVDGKGYTSDKGPGRPASGGGGGNYGGNGASSVTPDPTYGSITAPTNLGSGGTSFAGGGAVLLIVAGTTAVNGVISAVGSGGNNFTGSGGTVYLTTGALTGNGTIKANGGNLTGQFSGGGGRIAVILTNSTDFGNVTCQAYTGTGNSSFGAAGTVYQQTPDQAPGRGTLLIDAGNIVSRNALTTTRISSLVNDTTVGTVVITNLAIIHIYTNQSLTVNGSWRNENWTNASFIASSNSTVILASTNAATVYGSNTFACLVCTNVGKVVSFAANRTNNVRESLTLAGPVLQSTTNGTWWYLTLMTGAVQNVRGVKVRDSNAGGGQTIVIIPRDGAMDLGNNVNWSFPPPGTVYTAF
jgi:hypothetical protein